MKLLPVKTPGLGLSDQALGSFQISQLVILPAKCWARTPAAVVANARRYALSPLPPAFSLLLAVHCAWVPCQDSFEIKPMTLRLRCVAMSTTWSYRPSAVLG